MNARSIRFQLLAWYAALLLSAFMAFGVFMYAALGRLLRENLSDILVRRAQQIARGLIVAPTELTPPRLAQDIGYHYAPENSSRFVRISLCGTNALYRSGTPQDHSFDPEGVPRPKPPLLKTGVRTETLPGYPDLLVFQMPATVGTNAVLIEFGSSLAPIQAALWDMLKCLLVGVPLLIVVTGTGAYVLIGHTLQPVEQITRSAEAISLHNLDQRLPVAKSGDELEALSMSLNRMIGRIRDAFENTRRFVADASHELRTPLAVVRGEIEGVVTRDELTPQTRETLGSSLEEIERLGKTVEGLLALSRLDAGDAQAENVCFDLATLAATTAEQIELLAADKNISLLCESQTPVLIQGDRARLKQVIVNLIDNAVKYTPAGGTVKVTTRVQNSEAILEVNDNGIGIPQHALPHVFERFYRVDKARSRDFDGAGLGLSIVKSICHAHSGRVEIESTEGAGSTFRVRLPLENGNTAG